MLPTQQGAFRLFQISGITVFLHWSWFVVAAIRFQGGLGGEYGAPIFYVAEYLSLFLIVLMHEFGHSLSCRQVGGHADTIVLWPLGGVAYVRPPERPGAQLWSIAAGPLVNVALFPILYFAQKLAWSSGLAFSAPDTTLLLYNIYRINAALLIFNLIPVFPLDGGQILRSLLWFWIGRGKSMLVASGIGFLGVAGFLFWALSERSVWLGVIAAFIGMNCYRGWQMGRALLALEARPRRPDFTCPQCHQHPHAGPFWMCVKCDQPFDAFAHEGRCPNCGAHYEETRCTECGNWASMAQWHQARSGLDLSRRL